MSLGIFLLLLVPPFAATERAGTRFMLILMHVVAVAALLGLLAQAERQRARLLVTPRPEERSGRSAWCEGQAQERLQPKG